MSLATSRQPRGFSLCHSSASQASQRMPGPRTQIWAPIKGQIGPFRGFLDPSEVSSDQSPIIILPQNYLGGANTENWPCQLVNLELSFRAKENVSIFVRLELIPTPERKGGPKFREFARQRLVGRSGLPRWTSGGVASTGACFRWGQKLNIIQTQMYRHEY